jgi:hypothetical protein
MAAWIKEPVWTLGGIEKSLADTENRTRIRQFSSL